MPPLPGRHPAQTKNAEAEAKGRLHIAGFDLRDDIAQMPGDCGRRAAQQEPKLGNGGGAATGEFGLDQRQGGGIVVLQQAKQCVTLVNH